MSRPNTDTQKVAVYIRKSFIERLSVLPYGLSRLINASIETALQHPGELARIAHRGHEDRGNPEYPRAPKRTPKPTPNKEYAHDDVTVEDTENHICSDCITSDPRFDAIFEKHLGPIIDREMEDNTVYDREFEQREAIVREALGIDPSTELDFYLETCLSDVAHDKAFDAAYSAAHDKAFDAAFDEMNDILEAE